MCVSALRFPSIVARSLCPSVSLGLLVSLSICLSVSLPCCRSVSLSLSLYHLVSLSLCFSTQTPNPNSKTPKPHTVIMVTYHEATGDWISPSLLLFPVGATKVGGVQGLGFKV